MLNKAIGKNIMNLEKEKIFEFFRFGIVGVFATSIHYIIYYFLQKVFNVNIAYTFGYLISFIANFFLSSFFTFHVKPSFKKLIGMGGAHFINYLLQIVFLNILLYFGLPKVYAPIPIFIFVIPINFILVRIIFKHKKL
jgi:putative flippase GtrA